MEEIIKELELLLSDMTFAGLQNVQPVMLTKLDNIKDWFRELGMTGGVKQMDSFIEIMSSYQRGEASREDVIRSFCMLEFYQRTIAGNLELSRNSRN